LGEGGRFLANIFHIGVFWPDLERDPKKNKKPAFFSNENILKNECPSSAHV